MARLAKLGKKKIGKHIYWYTESGGKPVYFGNTKLVKRKEADEAFLAHRQAMLAKVTQSGNQSGNVSVGQLVDDYLAWSRDQFSDSNYANKKSSLQRWASHLASAGLPGAGKQLGDLAAASIEARHLNDFISARRRQAATAGRGIPKGGLEDGRPVKLVGANALAGDMQHVKACFNWAADQGHLPLDFRPFARVPRVTIPKRPKLESELITAAEIASLLKHADTDIAAFVCGKGRKRALMNPRTGASNPYAGFADMLRLYHGLGPRTAELAGIQVQHVDFAKCQVVVVRHKRDKTMSQPVPRTLTLNADELKIFKRHCAGKRPSDYVFTQPGGQPWVQDRLDERFSKIRELAGVRETITIYSYRHLWITEAIEADMPLATIAEMAGTSVKQIEATYGHIRHTHRTDARSRLDDYRKNKPPSSVA